MKSHMCTFTVEDNGERVVLDPARPKSSRAPEASPSTAAPPPSGGAEGGLLKGASFGVMQKILLAKIMLKKSLKPARITVNGRIWTKPNIASISGKLRGK